VVSSLKRKPPIGLKTARITAFYHEEAFVFNDFANYSG